MVSITHRGVCSDFPCSLAPWVLAFVLIGSLPFGYMRLTVNYKLCIRHIFGRAR